MFDPSEDEPDRIGTVVKVTDALLSMSVTHLTYAGVQEGDALPHPEWHLYPWDSVTSVVVLALPQRSTPPEVPI